MQWAIADLTRHIESHYGEKYEFGIKTFGFEYQTVANLKSVAGKFELSRRRENVSISIQADLQGLSIEDQYRWLDRVEAKATNRGVLRGNFVNSGC